MSWYNFISNPSSQPDQLKTSWWIIVRSERSKTKLYPGSSSEKIVCDLLIGMHGWKFLRYTCYCGTVDNVTFVKEILVFHLLRISSITDESKRLPAGEIYQSFVVKSWYIGPRYIESVASGTFICGYVLWLLIGRVKYTKMCHHYAHHLVFHLNINLLIYAVVMQKLYKMQ